jgi:hypothetical protein
MSTEPMPPPGSTNYLRDALRAAATEPLDACTLCGAVINRSYEEAHNHFHQAGYQPFDSDAPDAAVVACKYCGIIVDPSYREAHNRVHQADYQPFAADAPGARIDVCKQCGILVDPSYWDAHARSHA